MESNNEDNIIIPARKFFYSLAKYCLLFSILCFFAFFVLLFLTHIKVEGSLAFIILNLRDKIPENVSFILAIAGIIFLLFFILLKFTKAKKVRFDKWILKIASKRLGTDTIWYTNKGLLVNYDISLRPKDIVDFVAEISNKSANFTYYYKGNPDIDSAKAYIVPAKKQPIPTRTMIDTKTDVAWNIIPLGEAENHDLKKITPIGWYLNNQIKRDDMLQTLPSSHILISGGTGSGKSVLQNCIIGHISRFSEHFMLFLADIKKVEFGPLKKIKGVKKVGLELKEIENILSQAREIMQERFRMMLKYEVNDIYDLVGQEFLAFKINGEMYQEDEIFNCRVNGEEKLLTAKQIFEEFHSIKSSKQDDIEDFGGRPRNMGPYNKF